MKHISNVFLCCKYHLHTLRSTAAYTGLSLCSPLSTFLFEIISLAAKHTKWSAEESERETAVDGKWRWAVITRPPWRELAACTENTGAGRGAGPVAGTELTAGWGANEGSRQNVPERPAWAFHRSCIGVWIRTRLYSLKQEKMLNLSGTFWGRKCNKYGVPNSAFLQKATWGWVQKASQSPETSKLKCQFLLQK